MWTKSGGTMSEYAWFLPFILITVRNTLGSNGTLNNIFSQARPVKRKSRKPIGSNLNVRVSFLNINLQSIGTNLSDIDKIHCHIYLFVFSWLLQFLLLFRQVQFNNLTFEIVSSEILKVLMMSVRTTFNTISSIRKRLFIRTSATLEKFYENLLYIILWVWKFISSDLWIRSKILGNHYYSWTPVELLPGKFM